MTSLLFPEFMVGVKQIADSDGLVEHLHRMREAGHQTLHLVGFNGDGWPFVAWLYQVGGVWDHQAVIVLGSNNNPGQAEVIPVPHSTIDEIEFRYPLIIMGVNK